jgi:predicted lipid-binding transport protein (Tim44 family)
MRLPSLESPARNPYIRTVLNRNLRDMRRFLPLLLAVMLALAPALSWARPNFSAGSRGSHTYNTVPGTSTAPNGAAPFQRSMTPNYGNSYGNSYGQAYGGNYGGFRMRSPFTSGLLGGLIGAGLGGMLFGRGFFGGIHGGGGFLGFIIQMALLYFLVRWLYRRFVGVPAMAGGPGLFSRGFVGFQNMMPGLGGGGRSSRPVAIVQSDYQAFEALLKNVQAAWSAHDLAALQRFATPEMVGYFGEQMAEQASRGVRNQVSDVRLQQGDLAEAWSEGSREYATVALRYSMVDVTFDPQRRVVDGSLTERVTATEVWTFVRTPGGNWVLSAIQQTR